MSNYLSIVNDAGNSLINTTLPIYFLKEKVRLIDLPKENISASSATGYNRARCFKLYEGKKFNTYSLQNVYSYKYTRQESDIIAISMVSQIKKIVITSNANGIIHFNVPTDVDFSNVYIYRYVISLYENEVPDIGFGLELYNENNTRIFNSENRKYLNNLNMDSWIAWDLDSDLEHREGTYNASDYEAILVPVTTTFTTPCCAMIRPELSWTSDSPIKYGLLRYFIYYLVESTNFAPSEIAEVTVIGKDYQKPYHWNLASYYLTVGKTENQSYLVYGTAVGNDIRGNEIGIGGFTALGVKEVPRKTTGAFQIPKGGTVTIKYIPDPETSIYRYVATPELTFSMDFDVNIPSASAGIEIK